MLIIDPLEYGDTGSYAAYYDDGTARASATFCAITIRVGPLPVSGEFGLALLAGMLVFAGAFILWRSKA